MRKLTRALPAAACAALAGALLAGCGLTEGGDNLVNGKTQFVAKCGSCHVLNRAGTKGVTGPNLDEAFQQARKDGFGESTFAGMVKAQIKAPARTQQVDPATRKANPLMPANLVTGADAKDVAAYVAFAAAKGGEDPGRLASIGATQARGTARPRNGVVTIPSDPNGGLNYTFAEAEVPAGRVTLRSPNDSSVDHNIAVDGAGIDEKGPVVKNGGVSEITVELQTGQYMFYCSVTGHREAGMEGPLRVR